MRPKSAIRCGQSPQWVAVRNALRYFTVTTRFRLVGKPSFFVCMIAMEYYRYICLSQQANVPKGKLKNPEISGPRYSEATRRRMANLTPERRTANARLAGKGEHKPRKAPRNRDDGRYRTTCPKGGTRSLLSGFRGKRIAHLAERKGKAAFVTGPAPSGHGRLSPGNAMIASTDVFSSHPDPCHRPEPDKKQSFWSVPSTPSRQPSGQTQTLQSTRQPCGKHGGRDNQLSRISARSYNPGATRTCQLVSYRSDF
jgi:hypothetical protein